MEGLRNKLITNKDVEAVYDIRMTICKACPLYDTTGSGCIVPGTGPCCNKDKELEVDQKLIKGCGCSLSIKGRSMSASCPGLKWKAVMTEQDEEILNRQLNDNS